MKNPTLRILLLIILYCVVINFNCSPEKQQPTNEQITYGSTLKVMLTTSAENLDPQTLIFSSDWQVSSLLYEGLFKYNDNFNTPIPFLAESWKKSNGGKCVTIKLRKGVYFHDNPCFPESKGRELKAEDIVYTFERIASSEINCSNWYLFAGKIEGIDDFHSNKVDSINGIKIIDDYQIEFRLTKPYVSFIKLLAAPTTYIVPREAVLHYKDSFYKHPVGTGPFRLVRWKQWQELLLLKNTNYWRCDSNNQQLPYVDALQFRILSNYSLANSEFMKEDIHFLSINKSMYLDLQKDKEFFKKYVVAAQCPSLNFRFLGFSLDATSLVSKHTNLRKAIALAFDRDIMADNIMKDVMIPANSLVPPYFFQDTSLTKNNWYIFNRNKARNLAKDFNSLLKKLPIQISSNIEAQGILNLKKSLNSINIPLDINLKLTGYYRHIIEDRPDMFRVSFHPSYPDPEEYYSLFYSKSDPAINLTAYKNPEYDSTLEQAMIEQNNNKRQKLFLKLEKILTRDIPAIYLYHSAPEYYITHPYIHGLKISFGIIDYSEVWFEHSND